MIGKGSDCLFPLYVRIPDSTEYLRVRCGHCVNCKMYRAREWCMRLQMESHYWNSMCFVTLTYDDESLPKHIIDGRLYFSDEEIRNNPELATLWCPTHRTSDLTLFLKRLRKQLNYRIKYFAVGEYGTTGTKRSHLHILFFGLPFSRSTKQLVERCWSYGFVKVTPFFSETCMYVAQYVQKKLYGDNKDFFRLPEFMRCSQHLGVQWLYDHMKSIDDEHPYISMDGFKYGIPRYFRKILVKEGKLHDFSAAACVLKQKEELQLLSNDCECKGTTLSAFFEVFRRDSIEKAKRRNKKRNTTGDI